MSTIEEKIITAVLKKYQKVFGSLEKKSPEFPNIGNPPKSLVIHQFRQYKPEGMRLDDTIAVWRVTENDVQKLTDLSVEPSRKPYDGMYFSEGWGDFSISPDLNNVIIEWQVGPRYGRGFRYNLIYEDENITLRKEADLWVS